MVMERVQQMTVEDFLDFAESSEEHYEFIDGEPCLMSGGKLNHFRIIKWILMLLERQMENTDLEALPNGMLVRVGEASLVAPDVIVVRGQPQTESNTRILLNPILVVEVLSPTSIDHDRVLKRGYYWDVQSIQAYVIVEQEYPLVELYTRGASGWQFQRFTDLGDEVPLEALNCRLPLRDIYRRIDFEAASPGLADDA